MKNKKLILSVTAKECRFDYFRGTGKGGQKRNKTSNCCRCTHADSGAVGKSEEGRSQLRNKQKAFARMAKSEKFQGWLRLEVAKKTGQLVKIEEKVDRMLTPENIKVEGFNVKKGRWEVLNDTIT